MKRLFRLSAVLCLLLPAGIQKTQAQDYTSFEQIGTNNYRAEAYSTYDYQDFGNAFDVSGTNGTFYYWVSLNANSEGNGFIELWGDCTTEQWDVSPNQSINTQGTLTLISTPTWVDWEVSTYGGSGVLTVLWF
jgi:hypothetical protein